MLLPTAPEAAFAVRVLLRWDAGGLSLAAIGRHPGRISWPIRVCGITRGRKGFAWKARLSGLLGAAWSKPEGSKVAAIQQEKIAALWRQYQGTGDIAARNALVLENLGLVYQIANRYSAFARDSFDDLVQEGCLGLMHAVERFRPEYGAQFSTYAYPVIAGMIKNYLRGRRRLLGDQRGAGGRPVSLVTSREELMAPAELESLAGAVGEDFTERVVDRITTGDLLARLPLLERRVVQHFFYDDLTQREVARVVSRSASRISRLLRRALQRIRGLLLEVQREEGRLMSSGTHGRQIFLMTVVDPETGLFGAAHLERCLLREIERAEELRAPLSLVIARVYSSRDSVAPELLAHVAREIYRQVRVLDHVFRAGPEELGLIFSLPAQQAEMICERVREGLSDVELRCGIATYPRDAHTPFDLIEAARANLDDA